MRCQNRQSRSGSERRIAIAQLTYHTVPFSELSLDEWHDLLRLRINVFVVEQDCPYPELDDKDRDSFHLMGKNAAGEIVAYSRILPPGVSYDEVSIGRVVVDKKARGTGIGHEMLAESLAFIAQHFGKSAIRISAQTHLTTYYQQAGFETVGEGYLEDGIPHIEMVRPA